MHWIVTHQYINVTYLLQLNDLKQKECFDTKKRFMYKYRERKLMTKSDSNNAKKFCKILSKQVKQRKYMIYKQNIMVLFLMIHPQTLEIYTKTWKTNVQGVSKRDINNGREKGYSIGNIIMKLFSNKWYQDMFV